MWDLVPCLEIKARPPALGAQSLNHWILNHRILTTGPPGKSLNKVMDKFSYPYSRVFPCSGTLLILESLPMGQTGIFCLFMTALSSLQPSQHLSQSGQEEGAQFFPFLAFTITSAGSKVFTTEDPHQRAQDTWLTPEPKVIQ